MHFQKIKTIIIAVVIFLALFVFASEIARAASFQYRMLETLPGFFTADAINTDFPKLILGIYKFGIWTIGIAALFMLTIGGFMYMASAGNNATVTSAKGIIADSVLGVIAAMCAYLAMYVINPDLTTLNPTLVAAEVHEEEYTAGTIEADKGNTTTSGGCIKPVTAARGQTSWVYDQSLRGQTIAGVKYTDCSNFVASAYKTAGCKSPGGTTTSMYPNAASFSSPSQLKAGDAVVSKAGGHVVLCMDDGCTQIIHSPGKGKPVTVKNGSEASNKTGTFWKNAKVIEASKYCGGC